MIGKKTLNEGKLQLSGIEILLWWEVIGCSVAFIVYSVLNILSSKYLFDSGFKIIFSEIITPILIFTLIFGVVITACIFALLGIKNRKSYSVPLIRSLLVLTLLSFPVGTIIGFVLLKRINHTAALLYLNYKETVDYKNDFSLKDIKWEVVSLSKYQGKIIVLNFFSIQCKSSVKEISGFVEIFNKYIDKGVQFLGIALDDDKGEIKSFIEHHNINYPVLINDINNSIEDSWNIEDTPTTIILDPVGKILFEHEDELSKEDLIDYILQSMEL